MNPWLAGCLLIAGAVSAMNPPALLWEREYFTDRTAWFDRVIQVSDGGFVVAASVGGYESGNRTILRLDEDGNILWYPENLFHAQHAKWVEELPDGDFIATGTVQEVSGESYGVLLLRVDAEGSVQWAKVYNLTDDWDVGWCVTPLLDGGFAVCGEYDEYDAFVMRTDADGDSLWTRVFDTGHAEKAFRVLYVNGGLTLYVDGGQANGPMLVRYSMDGDILWQESYASSFPEPMAWGGDICLASDAGYMIASSFMSEIGQMDWEGNLLWHQPIPGGSNRCGLSLQPTMDGGYIFSGWEGVFFEPTLMDTYSPPVDTGWTKDGWLVKLDAEGNADWFIDHELGYHNIFYSACQLQGGGYIVAGQIDTHGYLLRYAPETGIEGGDEPSPIAALDEPFPNPSSGDFSISYTLSEVMEVDLAVYDLAGRRVGRLFTGTAEPGTHQAIWDPGDAPSGCYLVVLRTDENMETRRCVLMR